MQVKVLRMTEKPFELISQAYRLCYDSQAKDKEEEEKFIRACIKNKHTSPLEHCSVTLLISGISRTCSHQVVRHRIASYTQESQRYIDKNGTYYVMPESIANDKEAARMFTTVAAMCEAAYKLFQEKGVKKEDARFIMPQAIHTKIMMTINFRSLRNFLDLRLDKRAQWEIRAVAYRILKEMFIIDPDTAYIFEDIAEKHAPKVRTIKK